MSPSALTEPRPGTSCCGVGQRRLRPGPNLSAQRAKSSSCRRVIASKHPAAALEYCTGSSAGHNIGHTRLTCCGAVATAQATPRSPTVAPAWTSMDRPRTSYKRHRLGILSAAGSITSPACSQQGRRTIPHTRPAPPGGIGRRRAFPPRHRPRRGSGPSGWFPRSLLIRSTGSAPSYAPATSPRLRRRPSPWPPDRRQRRRDVSDGHAWPPV
jgi:hypothetical protein